MDLQTKVNKIRDDVMKEVGSEIEIIHKNVEEKVKTLEQNERSKIDKDNQNLFEQEKRRLMEAHNRNLSCELLDQKNRRLQAESRVIEDATSLIEQHLSKIRTDSKKYKDIVKVLILESSVLLESENLIVVHDEKDSFIDQSFLDTIQKDFKQKYNKNINYKIAKEKLNCLGGVVLKVEGKKISCNNTFEERLKVNLKEIRRMIATAVFKGGEL